ncbi:MAG: redoxin domain-containing protein [Oligoflexia bacterium]|nr:redoxin domain-containing protein [Oligoflexia bacterium]
MDLLKNMRLIMLLCLFFVLSCGDKFTEIPGVKKRLTASSLAGELPTTDGSLINLASDGNKITVLQFASDSCTVCAEEAKSFRSHLRDQNIAPSKIKLVSIIVGAILIDAQDWKSRLGVPWTVAYDTESIVFKKHCSQNTVPCIVIHSPEKGVVLSKHGVVKMDEILSHTGDWEN